MNKRKQGTRTLRTDAAASLDVDVGWRARMAVRHITAELDEALAPSGLSSVQFGLMCLIASAPDDTIGALADRAGLSQSTMSRNIDQLISMDLAELVASETDRRRRAVWLTEAGALRLQQAIKLWRPAHEALVRRLGVGVHEMLGGIAGMSGQ